MFVHFHRRFEIIANAQRPSDAYRLWLCSLITIWFWVLLFMRSIANAQWELSLRLMHKRKPTAANMRVCDGMKPHDSRTQSNSRPDARHLVFRVLNKRFHAINEHGASNIIWLKRRVEMDSLSESSAALETIHATHHADALRAFQPFNFRLTVKPIVQSNNIRWMATWNRNAHTSHRTPFVFFRPRTLLSDTNFIWPSR